MTLQADIIIIGAGAAGCVLADHLTRDGTNRVLLLEAGEPDRKIEFHVPAAFSKLFRTSADWNYEAEGALPGQTQYWPRGKTLGGSDSLNAMMYVRGVAADYDAWAAQGASGWGWEDVLPYFKRLEAQTAVQSDAHGTQGPMHVSAPRSPSVLTHAFIEAAQSFGLPSNPDYNGASQDGVGLTQLKQYKGARWSAADAYLKPAMKRPNLTVITGAQATRILLDGKVATGVEFIRDGQTETATAHRQVILSGGAINSPQLLMLSGVGPAAHLHEHGIEVRHDLPGVGQNLQDHPACGASYFSSQPISLFTAEHPHHLIRYLATRKGPLTSNVAEAVAFLRTRPELPAPDIELIFAPAFFMYHGFKSPKAHGFTIGSILLRPKSRGQITLHSADPLAHPRIQPNYLTAGDDLDTLVEGVRIARRVGEAAAFDVYRKSECWPGAEKTSDDDLRQFVLEQFQSLYHPIGTCRMGASDDPLAVVDSTLHVRGIEHLRVVDASVMPTLIGGHTVAPTLMIAEKAAG
jgi:choline dehydrogenase